MIIGCAATGFALLFVLLASTTALAKSRWHEGIFQQPAAIQDDDADLSAVISEHLRRRIVSYPTAQAPGTIVVDTPNTHLYFVLRSGKAIRYAVGVGRETFTWSGVKTIERMSEWPDWIPPAEMLQRQPYLPRMMAGGPQNPLGARAIYLSGTLYRIHGTNAPRSASTCRAAAFACSTKTSSIFTRASISALRW
jgi:lipoprotein-anchoring transpeptidase ErfK/SrfK